MSKVPQRVPRGCRRFVPGYEAGRLSIGQSFPRNDGSTRLPERRKVPVTRRHELPAPIDAAVARKLGGHAAPRGQPVICRPRCVRVGIAASRAGAVVIGPSIAPAIATADWRRVGPVWRGKRTRRGADRIDPRLPSQSRAGRCPIPASMRGMFSLPLNGRENTFDQGFMAVTVGLEPLSGAPVQ